MFNINEGNRIVMAQHPTDMRKGVNCLSEEVRGFDMAPTDGVVYIFVSKSRRVMKLLHWEHGDIRCITSDWKADGSIRGYSCGRGGLPVDAEVGAGAADGGDLPESRPVVGVSPLRWPSTPCDTTPTKSRYGSSSPTTTKNSAPLN